MENSTLHKTVAYLRVSTLDQNTEKNKTDILLFANQHDLGKVHFVEEICSGKTAWRNRLIAQLLNELKPHDVIIVSELSRLGRSMLECMEILAFATRKVVAFIRSKAIGNSMIRFKAKLLR
jgi:DNA invertase Pin-like site-specific DNA recombinase